jgi:hypothetical protein
VNGVLEQLKLWPALTLLSVVIDLKPGQVREEVAQRSAHAWLWVRYGIRYEARRAWRKAKDACAPTTCG